MTEGSARYDDDPGSTADSTWDEIIDAHQDDKVQSIRVSTGNSQPGTTNGLLNSLKLEFAGSAPTTYSFSK